MSEVVLEAARSANADYKVGDAVYKNVIEIDWDETSSVFGRDDEKTPANRGTISHYSTESIPLGATVNKVKLEMVATESESGTSGFDLDIDVLALDTRLDQTDYATQEAQLIYYPDYNVYPLTSLWNDSRTSGSDHTISMPLNIEHGVGSIAQAWRCDVAPSAGKGFAFHYFYLERDGSMSSTTVVAKIYEAIGPKGNQVRGQLIDAGYARDADDIATGSPASFHLGTEAGINPATDLHVNANAWVPTLGETYISELTFSGGSGSSHIKVGLLTDAAEGDTDNISIYARNLPLPERVLQGFGGYAQWLTGADIAGAAVVGSTDTLTGSGVPTFNSGDLYGFGDSGYSGGTYSGGFTTLSNLTANVQAALSARTATSQHIGIRLQDFNNTGTEDRQRSFRSLKHASATADGKYGMLLTIDYTSLGAKATTLDASGQSIGATTGGGVSVSGATGSGGSTTSLEGTSE